MYDLSRLKTTDNTISSSKGDQLKWNIDNYWYKADRNGYEGLSEYVISQLLKKSSLNEDEYVLYKLDQIKYNNKIINCCKSINFLEEGSKLITLERLYQLNKSESLTSVLSHMDTYEERLKYLCDSIVNITGLNKFGEYLYKMLVIDALFLNEDRHLHNIAVIMYPNGKYDYCPIFDNGASLLSDVDIDYPLNENTIDLIKNVKSKTIGPNFKETLEVAEKLYGTKLEFHYDEKDIDNIVNKCDIYDSKVRNRIKQVLKYQRNKMTYYF